MSGRVTLILLVLVLGVGGAYWWWEARPSQLAQRTALEQGRLRLRADRVSEFTLQRGAESWVTRRVDDEWRLVEPLPARADAGEIDRLLTQFEALLPGEKVIAAEEAATLDLGDYGLFPPRYRLEWVQDEQRRVVLIGQRAPLGPHVYVQWADRPGIWAVSDELLALWPEQLTDLRDRLGFLGDPQRVYRVDVRRPDGFLQLVKDAEGTWRLAQPFSGLANRGAVREWIEQLFAMRIEDFVAEAVGEGGIYGLGEEALQVTVWVEGRDGGQSMMIGRPVEDAPEQVYAQRSVHGSVFTVPAALAGMARVQTDDLRDHALVPVPLATIHTIRLLRDQDTVVVLKRETAADAWWVEHPARWLADQERVEELLATWGSVRVKRFHEKSPDADEQETEPGGKEWSLEFVGPDEERVAIHVQGLKHGADAKTWLVTRNGLPQPLEIPAQPLAATEWEPLHYRHRQILNIAPAEVRSITQVSGGQEWSFTRDRAGTWRPPNGHAELPPNFDEIKATLLQLTAAEFVKDPLEHEADYGLDEPQAVWTLRLSAEAGIARSVMIGAPREQGGVYARTRGQRALFWLDEATAEWLRAPVYPAVPDDPAHDDE